MCRGSKKRLKNTEIERGKSPEIVDRSTKVPVMESERV